MARGDGPDREAPEPLARLLARSDAVARELERARERLGDLAERYEADEPLATSDEPDGTAPLDGADDGAEDTAPQDPSPQDPSPQDPSPQDPSPQDRSRDDVVVVPEAEEAEPEPSRDRDISMLQEAARRRLSDER